MQTNPNPTRPTDWPITPRRARATAEADALAFDWRDPLAEVLADDSEELDRLAYGRAWAGLI